MRRYISDAFLSAGIYVYSTASRRSYGSHILTREQAEELFSSYKSKFIEVDGLRVHYRDEGEGETIVLLHGFGASLHTWEIWAKSLKDKYRVIRIDIPGFGLSDAPARNKVNVSFFTHFLHHFLNQLGIRECNLVGNSFGGWMAWEFALLHPNQVKNLILIAAAGYFTKDTQVKAIDFANKGFFKKLLVKGVPRFIIKTMVQNAFGDKKKVNDFMINRYYGLANREGNLASIIKFATQTPIASTDKIKDIQHPTLIMWGKKDKVIHYVDALKFKHDIPHSQLVVYESVGHVPMEELPDETLNDLKVFLNKTCTQHHSRASNNGELVDYKEI